MVPRLPGKLRVLLSRPDVMHGVGFTLQTEALGLLSLVAKAPQRPVPGFQPALAVVVKAHGPPPEN